MSIEAAVVIDRDNVPMKWHLPPNRTSVALPDDYGLWDFIWSRRDEVAGIAHTHPGFGRTSYSYEDVTTFSAIELALGRRLQWWIATEDCLMLAIWAGPGKYEYALHKLADEPLWLPRLRELSR